MPVSSGNIRRSAAGISAPGAGPSRRAAEQDEELMEAYLEAGELDTETFIGGLKKAMAWEDQGGQEKKEKRIRELQAELAELQGEPVAKKAKTGEHTNHG